MSQPLGLSGRLARFFLENQLTPLLALTALLMGAFAVLVTPREEEPQIDVTFANIMIPFPGASSEQVENLVATPMEKVLGEIAGVKHIYSVSRPGLAVLTVQYEVGIHRNDATTRSIQIRIGVPPASVSGNHSSSRKGSTTFPSSP